MRNLGLGGWLHDYHHVNTLDFSINGIGSDLSSDTGERNVDYETEIVEKNIIYHVTHKKLVLSLRLCLEEYQ